MNKKAMIANIIGGIILLVIAIALFSYAGFDSAPSAANIQACSSNCSAINQDFYKLDEVRTYGYTNYYCYCINKEKQPINIGTIKI
jgi:hypothetical protein